MKIYSKDFELDTEGKSEVTTLLQKILDDADEVVINPGVYLTGPLFLHTGSRLELEAGAVLLATTDEARYPEMKTRVAGVDMEWYPAVLNAIDCEDVVISGKGMINGNGKYWYNKYWGEDEKGGMRKEYDEKGLRSFCDYDCRRPRNVLIQHCEDVTVKEITSFDSGFWNIHLLYSSDIHIDGVMISSGNLHSPSTDGIDIDSCEDVLVENVTSSTNDDSICIKSGRDYSGYLRKKECHDITIRRCHIKRGFGITIGSEVTGGVSDVTIEDVDYDGTDCGFRIKSAPQRKGYIRNITIRRLKMHNVKYAFHMELNWNPSYSLCTIPKGLTDYPKYYELLAHPMPNLRNTEIADIRISDVTSDYDADYEGISRAFNISGFPEEPISGLDFINVRMKAKEYGFINNADVHFKNCDIKYVQANDARNDSYDNR